MYYVKLLIGNPALLKGNRGKLAIVGVSEDLELTIDYRDKAFEIACREFKLKPDESIILDWQLLGNDITFIV